MAAEVRTWLTELRSGDPAAARLDDARTAQPAADQAAALPLEASDPGPAVHMTRGRLAGW